MGSSVLQCASRVATIPLEYKRVDIGTLIMLAGLIDSLIKGNVFPLLTATIMAALVTPRPVGDKNRRRR